MQKAGENQIDVRARGAWVRAGAGDSSRAAAAVAGVLSAHNES